MNQCFWTNLLDEWFNDSLTDFTCFITGWISVFEQISRMNDSMTHSLTLLASLLDESVFLNKSLGWMIQRLTHWLQLILYWMNQCFWTNLLDEWFNDSLTDFNWFITGWICFWTNLLDEWFNDSLTSLASLLDESVFLNKSLGWMIQCFTDFTCFITGWISVFEQISWMNDSMTHSFHLLHYWMNQCFWIIILKEWLKYIFNSHSYLKWSLSEASSNWFQITTVLVCNSRLCCGVLRCRRAHTALSKRLRVSPPHYHR